jgi:hypothetical protein
MLVPVEIGREDVASMIRLGLLSEAPDRATIGQAVMRLAILGYRMMRDGTSRADPGDQQHGQGDPTRG